MELLVLLVLLVAADTALWLGWGADSRDNANWDPAPGERRRLRQRRPDRLGPAEPHLAPGDPNVVSR